MKTYYLVHMKDLDAREGGLIGQFPDYLAARERFDEAVARLRIVQGRFRVWMSAAGQRSADQLDVWETGQ